jgi:hypothetical protein
VTIGGSYGADGIVEQYDPLGNRIWSRRLVGTDAGVLAADHQGGVVGAGPVPLTMPVLSYILRVNKLDSSGSMVWRTEMAVSQPSQRFTTLVDARGNVLIPGTGAALGLLRANVHELSADGRSCRVFEVDDASLGSFARIATSASGHGLFFQETRNRSETEYELSFGRLAYSQP